MYLYTYKTKVKKILFYCGIYFYFNKKPNTINTSKQSSNASLKSLQNYNPAGAKLIEAYNKMKTASKETKKTISPSLINSSNICYNDIDDTLTSSVTVNYSLTPNTTDRTLILKIQIAEIEGVPPLNLWVGTILQAADDNQTGSGVYENPYLHWYI